MVSEGRSPDGMRCTLPSYRRAQGTRDKGDRQSRRLAPWRHSRAGIFLGRNLPSDWIWEIATVGIACWMKRARYNGRSACARMRKRWAKFSAGCRAAGSRWETGTHSPWITRLLSELGHEVIVAHARKVRLIGDSRNKHDRLDAQTLARLARIDPQLLCPVKHRSAQGASGSDDN